MANDTSIKLPRSFDAFTVDGSLENGKPVWFRLTLSNFQYKADNGSATIRGDWSLKKRITMSSPPFWWPNFLWPKTITVWRIDSTTRDNLCGGYSSYQTEMVSLALNAGIILSPSLVRKICAPADDKIDELRRKVSDAYRNGLRLAA